MANVWRRYDPSTIAVALRKQELHGFSRQVQIGPNDVAIIVQDGQPRAVSGAHVRTSGIVDRLAGLFGKAANIDVYVAKTSPFEFAFFVGDDTSADEAEATQSMGASSASLVSHTGSAAVRADPHDIQTRKTGFQAVTSIVSIAALTADSQRISARVRLTLRVDEEDVELLVGMLSWKEVLSERDVAIMVRDEFIDKVFVPEVVHYRADELRGNVVLLRDLEQIARQKLKTTFDLWGLRLENFSLVFGLTEQERVAIEDRRSQIEEERERERHEQRLRQLRRELEMIEVETKVKKSRGESDAELRELELEAERKDAEMRELIEQISHKRRVDDQDRGLLSDRRALQAVKASFAGMSKLYWSEDIDIGEWEGVSVEGTSMRVTELALQGYGLIGEIPHEIGRLVNLEKLDLRDNTLGGKIPRELTGLRNLKEMYLSGNRLIGEIPREIGRLTNLERLDLGRNDLTGKIPREIGRLTNLERLYLNCNSLEGQIPREIVGLKNLKILYLSYNYLIGEIPSEIGNLANLKMLFLEGNRLTGEIPSEIGRLTNLEYLDLEGNGATVKIPQELFEHETLKVRW